jgi:hypothetical protein
MKVQITISTDDGATYQGEVELSAVTKPTKRSRPKDTPKPALPSRKFDFTLPLRAFVTAHGARKLSGPQKFTLLLAAIAKGDTTVSVDNNRLQKEWNRMTEPMGGRYNTAYPTRAHGKGWIESPKRGVYKLRSTWSEAIAS